MKLLMKEYMDKSLLTVANFDPNKYEVRIYYKYNVKFVNHIANITPIQKSW